MINQQWFSRKSRKKKTSNYNIRLTVKRKRVFCRISFLLPLEFCKSFTLEVPVGGGGGPPCSSPITAVPADYCANPELSSTLAQRLN